MLFSSSNSNALKGLIFFYCNIFQGFYFILYLRKYKAKKKLEIKSNNRQFSFEGKEGNYIFEEERFCNYSSGNISFFSLKIYYLYVYFFFCGSLWIFRLWLESYIYFFIPLAAGTFREAILKELHWEGYGFDLKFVLKTFGVFADDVIV